MADGIILVTSLFALVSTSTSLLVTASKFTTNVRNAPTKHKRLLAEIHVLRDVVDECHEVLGRVKAPQHVRESLISCFDMGKEVAELLYKARGGAPISFDTLPLKEAVRLVLRDDELTKAAAVFRERVVLLRDMCSE